MESRASCKYVSAVIDTEYDSVCRVAEVADVMRASLFCLSLIIISKSVSPNSHVDG